jgi:MFS family permease
MNRYLARDHSFSRWGVFGAASLAFFFLNLATFTSMGVVLFTMVAELHWSYTAAGFSFAFLGLACGLSSPLPALTMGWIGGRATTCLGAVMLMIGFTISSITQGIFEFYIAMLFLGLGYSFAGNVPGIYLISGWFKRGSARVIGLYLMLGALGAAVGPPIVENIVQLVGWRGQWQVMAIAAAVLGILCFALVRDPSVKTVAKIIPDLTLPPSAAANAGGWTPRQAVRTPQFILIACAMAATMACVTTNASVTPNHLVKLGASEISAAYVLGVMGFVATMVKALSGWLCEKVSSTTILAAGLVMECAGNVMLAFAATPALQYGSAVIFGVGWGLAYVAGTVVLLDFFGGETGSRILSIVWLLTSVAAVGPPAAGAIADRYGTFAPIFIVYAVLLVALATPILLMRRPVNHSGADSGARDAGLGTAATVIR